MQVITQSNCQEFRIEFNGGKTYFVTDCHGDCWGTFPTERKARNAFAHILKAQGKA